MSAVMTNNATRWLAALVASALVLALMIGGDQPSAQAIGPGETDIAYVADGYNFPDALMGATLATLNNAPMLGVRSPSTGDVVPPETADELDRLTNDKANKLATIYVFGGPAAVSDKVVGDLGAWANNVQRIFGDNRFGTMKAISEMLPTKAKDSDLLDGKDSSAFVDSSEAAGLLPVAVVNVAPDGTLRVSRHRSPVTGTPVVNHTGGSNIYDIDLPGMQFRFDDDAINCTASSGPHIIRVNSINGNDVRVFVSDDAGNDVEGGFYCAIYSLD